MKNLFFAWVVGIATSAWGGSFPPGSLEVNLVQSRSRDLFFSFGGILDLNQPRAQEAFGIAYQLAAVTERKVLDEQRGQAQNHWVILEPPSPILYWFAEALSAPYRSDADLVGVEGGAAGNFRAIRRLAQLLSELPPAAIRVMPSDGKKRTRHLLAPVIEDLPTRVEIIDLRKQILNTMRGQVIEIQVQKGRYHYLRFSLLGIPIPEGGYDRHDEILTLKALPGSALHRELMQMYEMGDLQELEWKWLALHPEDPVVSRRTPSAQELSHLVLRLQLTNKDAKIWCDHLIADGARASGRLGLMDKLGLAILPKILGRESAAQYRQDRSAQFEDLTWIKEAKRVQSWRDTHQSSVAISPGDPLFDRVVEAVYAGRLKVGESLEAVGWSAPDIRSLHDVMGRNIPISGNRALYDPPEIDRMVDHVFVIDTSRAPLVSDWLHSHGWVPERAPSQLRVEMDSPFRAAILAEYRRGGLERAEIRVIPAPDESVTLPLSEMPTSMIEVQERLGRGAQSTWRKYVLAPGTDEHRDFLETTRFARNEGRIQFRVISAPGSVAPQSLADLAGRPIPTSGDIALYGPETEKSIKPREVRTLPLFMINDHPIEITQASNGAVLILNPGDPRHSQFLEKTVLQRQAGQIRYRVISFPGENAPRSLNDLIGRELAPLKGGQLLPPEIGPNLDRPATLPSFFMSDHRIEVTETSSGLIEYLLPGTKVHRQFLRNSAEQRTAGIISYRVVANEGEVVPQGLVDLHERASHIKAGELNWTEVDFGGREIHLDLRFPEFRAWIDAVSPGNRFPDAMVLRPGTAIYERFEQAVRDHEIAPIGMKLGPCQKVFELSE